MKRNNTLNWYTFISWFVRNQWRKIIDRFAYKSWEYYFVQTEWNTIKKATKLWVNKQMAYKNFQQMIK